MVRLAMFLPGLLVAVATSAAEPAVAANPFDRPAWLTDAREADPTDVSRSLRPRFDVRATLKSDSGGLANIAGRLIEVGDEYEGYRLVAVGVGEVVLTNGAETIRIAVNKDDEDQDDDAS